MLKLRILEFFCVKSDILKSEQILLNIACPSRLPLGYINIFQYSIRNLKK